MHSAIPQHAVLRLSALVAVLLLLCVSTTSALVWLRPTPIGSYEDQVADALRQHRIEYQHIQLGERWPDHINFQYGSNVFPYSYQVEVTLKDHAKTVGWLTCAKLERACTLSMADLELRNIPLRDFSTQYPLPVLGGLLAYIKQVLP